MASPEVSNSLHAMRQRLQIEFLKEDVPRVMRESLEGISRVRQIVQDLKDFSRIDSVQEWQPADLHQGIDSALNIVSSEVRFKAEVVKEYGQIPEVACLPSQINQVAMNLVVNAAHAMGPERGRIVVRTGSDDDEVWIANELMSDPECRSKSRSAARTAAVQRQCREQRRPR